MSREPSRRPLISRASIVILAAFLIGISTAASVPLALRGNLQICGLVGLISLVALYFVAVGRETELAVEAAERETEKVRRLLAELTDNVADAIRSRTKELCGSRRDNDDHPYAPAEKTEVGDLCSSATTNHVSPDGPADYDNDR